MNYKLNSEYELTTESPASHYGIPVVVGINGGAYGPASELPFPEKFRTVFGNRPNTCDAFVYSWANELIKDDLHNVIGMARTKDEVVAASKFLGQWPEGRQINLVEVFEGWAWKLNHEEDSK